MGSRIKELRKLNNQMDKRIHTENQSIFTDMICYIRGANISDYNQELIRCDLSEMILSAQDRGEDIHLVIGGDFKAFCDEVIASLPPKSAKDNLYERLDIFCSSMAILGTINILLSKDFRRVIDEMFSNQATNYDMGISIGMIISTALIMIAAIFIVNAITKNAFKMTSNSSQRKRMLVGGVAGTGIMTLFIAIAKYGRHVAFSVNIFLAMLLLLGFFIAHKVLNRI